MSEAHPRPLERRRILVTRAAEKGAEFAAILEERGARVLRIPLIRFEDPESWDALDQALRRLDEFQILLFTSATAVDRFFDRFLKISGGGGILASLSVAVVGPKTARAVEKHGHGVRWVAQSYQAEGLLEMLPAERVRGVEILFPRAQEARELLVDELERRGARITLAPVYRTVPVTESRSPLQAALGSRAVDAVTFTSASTVRHFVELAEDSDLPSRMRGIAVACFGRITAEEACSRGLSPDVVSARSTLEDFTDAIARHFARRGGEGNAVPGDATEP
ncbi:MAG TPA: uroporphyrinogen-III synthase [Candidatus Polarisedimenticolia bacterium]|nr:uroporphyrinogen-III synthase [Candidatus Polarisedimenticolia bacterium]